MSNKHRDNSVLGSILTQLHKELREQTNETITRTELIDEANSLFDARALSPRTVEKWFKGDVANPRDWCGLLMLLAALKADRGSANQALLAAGLSSIGEIIPETDQEEEVLKYWKTNNLDSGSAAPVIQPMSELPPKSRLYGFHQNPHFVGRGDVLVEMFEQLQTNRGIFLTGMSGVGKTQLAIEFAYRYAKAFTGGIFFINCADPKIVDREISMCGGIQGMKLSPHYEEWQLVEQVAAVKQAWRDNVPRLLIFDNVEASNDVNVEQWLIEDIIPQSGGNRVIVTTTKDTWSPILQFSQVKLTTLKRGESIQMLRTQAPQLTEASAEQIADTLGDLPLALYGAGCYLRQYYYSVSPESYIHMLNKHSSFVSDKHYKPAISPTRHEMSVERTFSLNYEKLNPENTIDRLALQLLRCLAYLAPGDPVPISLLNVYFSLESSYEAFEFKIEDVLQRLSDLGLVQITSDAVTIHRLLIRFLLKRVEQPEYLYTALANAVVETKNLDTEIDERWLSHVYYLSSDLIHQEKTQEAAILVSRFGTFMNLVLDISNAKSALEWAFQIQKDSIKTDPLQLAYTYHQLALLYSAVGDLDTAGRYYEAELAIHRQSNQVDHREMAKILNNLGYISIRYGNLSQARQYLVECLDIRKRPDIDDGVIRNNNIGLLAFLEAEPNDLEALSSALALLQHGLEYKLNFAKRTRSLSIAYSYARIGIVQHAMGDTMLGEQSLNHAVINFRLAFPTNSIGPGLELYNFALLLKINQRYDSAHLCATRAVALLTEADGNEVVSYLQLAKLLLAELAYEESH
jgi:tetratricopeptide (TPR) repeat protein